MTVGSDLAGPLQGEDRPVDRPTVLAVDVGGTKLAVGLVDGRGTVLVEARNATGGRDAEELFGSLSDLVRTVLDEAAAPPVGIGVGCGGPMSGPPDDRSVSPLNISQWQDFPLSKHLSESTGLPVVVDNDAKALALGEGWCGAAAGCRNYLAMVVSTGVGGGVVLDGRLLDGASGNAGHVGHVVVEPDGPPCACGARGCLEAVASGSAIARRAGSRGVRGGSPRGRRPSGPGGRLGGELVGPGASCGSGLGSSRLR